jgi:hypothetical protein
LPGCRSPDPSVRGLPPLYPEKGKRSPGKLAF